MRIPPAKCDEVKQRILQVLVQVKYVSLTTDIWTSKTTEGFLTVTAHFICLYLTASAGGSGKGIPSIPGKKNSFACGSLKV